MTKLRSVVDLRDEAPARVGGAAFAQARQLRRGDTLRLLVSQEPSLMMQSLNLQLRGNLAWTIAVAECGWQVKVQHRAETPAQDLLDLLAREHKRLDQLMARLLQRVNGPDRVELAPVYTEFAALLRRHISFENKELAPLCAAGEPRTPDAPTAIMLREHEEILRQLSVIEESIAADDRGEVSAFVAILSGTLAKHEHREENGLFPRWRQALSVLSPQARADLLVRAASGPEG